MAQQSQQLINVHGNHRTEMEKDREKEERGGRYGGQSLPNSLEPGWYFSVVYSYHLSVSRIDKEIFKSVFAIGKDT